MIIASEAAAKAHGLTPRARILGMAPLQLSWLAFAVTLVCTRFWRRSRNAVCRDMRRLRACWRSLRHRGT